MRRQLSLILPPQYGQELHILDTILDNLWSHRPLIEHLITPPFLRRKQLKPHLFPRLKLTDLIPSQPGVRADTPRKAVDTLFAPGTSGKLHKLQIPDPRHGHAEEVIECVCVAADVKETFWYRWRLEDGFEGGSEGGGAEDVYVEEVGVPRREDVDLHN